MAGKHSATESINDGTSLNSKSIKLIVKIIILVLIVLLVCLGIYFYKRFFYSNNGVVPSISQNENPQDEINGYKILGRIEIDKINVNQYILEKATEESLEIATAKLYGPNINEKGNFCIIGHNYKDIFEGLKKLQKEDKFFVYDKKDNKVEYEIYEIQSVEPKDLQCLMQNTNNEKEVTLITCNIGAETRLVIKAKEIKQKQESSNNTITNDVTTNTSDSNSTQTN